MSHIVNTSSILVSGKKKQFRVQYAYEKMCTVSFYLFELFEMRGNSKQCVNSESYGRLPLILCSLIATEVDGVGQMCWYTQFQIKLDSKFFSQVISTVSQNFTPSQSDVSLCVF